MDFKAFGILNKLDNDAVLKAHAARGLYSEYAACSAIEGNTAQETGFFANLFNGAGELEDIEKSLTKLHACMLEKIAMRCPAPEEPVEDLCEGEPVDMGELADHPKMTAFVDGCPNGNIRNVYGIGKGNAGKLEDVAGITTVSNINTSNIVNLYNIIDVFLGLWHD